MWSSVGPEFLRGIDPQLKWKTSSNGKQRVLRRARTFRQDNKKYTVMNLKVSENLFDEESKKIEDTPVSEFEKLGVSILGRRFTDNNIESGPIKKRRLSLLSLPSPPHAISSSVCSDHILRSHLALFHSNHVSMGQDEPGINPYCRVDWDQGRSSADEKRSLESINKQICDSADFSGISILAAAACGSSMERGLMNTEGSSVGRNCSEENPILSRFSQSHKSEDVSSYDPEFGDSTEKSSAATFAAVVALGRELSELKSDESKMENSVGSLQSFPRKMK